MPLGREGRVGIEVNWILVCRSGAAGGEREASNDCGNNYGTKVVRANISRCHALNSNDGLGYTPVIRKIFYFLVT